MSAYAQVAQIGTATIWQRQREIDPILRALCSISLGAQDLHSYRSSRLNRRGLSGVQITEEQIYTVHLEAYGPTRTECEQAIARYLKAKPWASWRTSFEPKPRCIDGEFVARGHRNAIEGWAL